MTAGIDLVGPALISVAALIAFFEIGLDLRPPTNGSLIRIALCAAIGFGAMLIASKR